MTETPRPPAPCGYCRRCAVHDDPGGCLEVERWERERPIVAALALANPCDREEALVKEARS